MKKLDKAPKATKTPPSFDKAKEDEIRRDKSDDELFSSFSLTCKICTERFDLADHDPRHAFPIQHS